jgi:nitroreductase
MDAVQAIMTRRSIRDFTSEPVTAAQVRCILECAMNAPSAGNQQPWHFIVIDDRKVLDALPTVHPYCQMALAAPLAIAVCGDGASAKHRLYWQHDCAAAIENLLLAVHALGLGAVWTAVYPDVERTAAVQRLLGLPENIAPVALIPIGHPAEQPEQTVRYREDRVHKNGW